MKASRRDSNRHLTKATEDLRQICRNHSLDHATMAAWLQEAEPRLVLALDHIFGESDQMPTRRDLQALGKAIETRLDVIDPFSVDLSGPGLRAVRALRAVFAAVTLILSIWVVVGSIFAGQNELAASTSTSMTICVLVAALIILALLEAAHIGAVALSTADVSALKSSHPRVFKLHHHIDTKEKLESYLAARQVGVVMVVFLISEVTRTVGLQNLPGTQMAIPPAFDILFRIGAPGALMVLIIGQVMPQIVTARRPAAMMNLAPMAVAFHLTRLIGKLGLASPASWLVCWSRSTERIPSAPRERYVSGSVDVEGYGVLAVRRSTTVGASGSRTTSVTTVAFHDDTRTSLSLDLTSMPVKPNRLRIVSGTIDGDVFEPAVMGPVEEERMTDRRGVLLTSTISPRAGAFHAGQILEISTAADFTEALGDDFMFVSTPTKVAVMNVVLDHPPVPLPPAVLSIIRATDGEILHSESVSVRMQDTGTAEFFVAVHYPDAGTIIHLRWARTAALIAGNEKPSSLEVF